MNDAGRLVAELTALLVQGESEWVKDDRDLQMALAPYHVEAHRLGLDVPAVFAAAAEAGPAPLRDLVAGFGRRTDVTPEAFGLHEQRPFAAETVRELWRGGFLDDDHDVSEDVLRSMYGGFGRLATGGDIRAYVEAHYTLDCEYDPTEEDGVVRGTDEMVAWNKRWFEVWDELEATPVTIEDAGGAKLVHVSVRGRASGSSAEVTQSFFHLAELRDGRITRLREFLTRAEALRAADDD